MKTLGLDDPTKGINLRAHRIIAGLILLFSLVLYSSTVAPTTSFWDCGEFIASSYSMGVPHPPGAPFFLLLGRVFSLFVPLPDIGLRVNMLSVILSALTVLLTYLIIVRLVRRWRGPEETTTDKVVLYGSGAIGALVFAASHSFWFNAVEAEVYAISMFFTALVFWLAVRWSDMSNKHNATMYLLMISYFVGLAIGIHLLNVLALCPIVFLIYFQKYKFTWKSFIVAGIISLLAIGIVYPGVVGGVPKVLKAGPIWQFVILAGLIGVTVWAIRSKKHLTSIVMSSILLVLIGYSTYAVIYIRSNLDPEINENQPDTVERLISYLNREQYGAVGPVEMQDASRQRISQLRRSGAKFMPLAGGKILRFHIFERNAPFWSYQINKMYVRYLSWQFFVGEKGQVYIIPFLLGLMGMIWHFWRDPKRGTVVMMLFLMTGIAIVFYLNQADPQPRERDYAYVGSFFAFALWIGMGVAALFEFIEDLLHKKNPVVQKGLAWGSVAALVALAPMNMIFQNYDSHDRKGNYVAWDYSHNMLESCEPNAIIFTNGDNDTFPLWYLQVVEGIRRDVRIVNLSLLNTDWYIKQLRDREPKVQISFGDRDIEERLTGMTDEALLLRYWPANRRNWSIKTPEGKLEWEVPATLYIPTGMPNERSGEPNFLRVQDLMILHIVEQANWKRPIYFAVTVSQSNLIGLQDYMTMEGLVFKLHPKRVKGVDRAALEHNLFEVYPEHYRNLNNPDVYYFDNIKKLLQNYRSAYLQLVYDYYSDPAMKSVTAPSGIPEEQWDERYDELTVREKAIHTLRMMDTVMPSNVVEYSNPEVPLQVARLYFELGDKEFGKKYIDHVLENSSRPETSLQAAYYLGHFGGMKEEAAAMVKATCDEYPSTEILYNAAAILERMEAKEELISILDDLAGRKDLAMRDQLDVAGFYFNAQAYTKAAAFYEELAKEYPANGEVQGGLISTYREMKDTQNVVRTLESWIERHPEDKSAAEILQQWKK